MTGARFERVVLNRKDLRQPFPTGFARRLRHATVRAITRRGKYLLADLSSGDTLIMHLGMSGSFRVEPTRALRRGPRDPDADLENRHDHVVFMMSSGMTVIVYDREGAGCPTPGCGGTIARSWQAGRSTFYCPVCQR